MDLVAVEDDVLQQLRQQGVGLEGEEVVVQAEEHQRQHHGDEAFVLQLQADLGHHPAQQAGDGHDEQGDQQQEQNARQQVQRGGGHRRPIDDDGRQHHHTRVHEAHEVHPQQPGGDEGIHRNGEGEHLVIVLGQVEAGIGGEHAAEGTQQDGHKAHDGEIEPAHAGLGHAPAHGKGQGGEHTADDAYHQKDEEDDVAHGGRLGASPVLLGVVDVGTEDLRQLLFDKKLQHDSPSSSRKTSSRESSPLTSSMVPERMRRPPLMMATLSHSFSATSSTWVEKKMAPP